MNYNGEITARACFVRIGRDPDEDPKLLGEIQRALEDAVDSAYILFARPAAECEATQAVVEAAGKVEAVCYEGIPANFIKDLASTAQELRVALARLRALGKG